MQRQSCAWFVCCQLVVIIPGLQQGKTFPDWPTEIAKVLTGENEKQIKKAIVNLEDGENPDSSPKLLLYDWSKLSERASIVMDDRVGGTLATVIRQKSNRLKPTTKKPPDVLIVAHSRGCYVACEAARRLKSYAGLGYVQMVMLDPVPEGNDGELEANPGGIVDWITNYNQTFPSSTIIFQGRKIPGALNINLDSVLIGMPLLKDETRHSQVHRWYQGLWQAPPKMKEGDFLKLYGGNPDPKTKAMTGPLVELFNYTNGGISFHFAQGTFGPDGMPKLGVREKLGLNMVRNHALEMTDPRPWVAAGVACRSVVDGGFTAEFTIHMKDKLKTKENLDGADGIVFYIRDADRQPLAELGALGGAMGYGRMVNNGFGIAFDPYANWEHQDPKLIANRISLRVAGQIKYRMVTEKDLPAPLNSGTPFRVRVSIGSTRTIAIKVYSYAADKSVDIVEELPPDVEIPQRKVIGFSAATGTAAQRHIIDDIIIVPLGQ